MISELSTGYPGYDSIITPDKATIGTILKENGYATSWFGKNHNTPGFQYSVSGPFDQWPSGMGFDYFYGFMGGETDQWTPYLFQDHTQIYPWIGKPGYNLTTDLADEAIQRIRGLDAAAPEQPFFVYYVPGGSHSPHQPTPEWIDKFKGKFDMGWNAMRDQIFANQKKLGVIPANAQLTPWPDDLAKWETLSADEKKLFARQAEVFAAYTAYTDHEIGRVIQAVEDLGKLDNTLIIYIDGDNGTSPEGSTLGTPNQFTAYNGVLDVPVEEQLTFYDKWGSSATYPHMAVAWSWAFDTPFKWTKQVASHFGGTRQGLAISWPARIKDAGGIRHQFHHIIDIVPTILEATGIPAPQQVDGIPQKPIEGVSMAYTFDKANADAPSARKTQYFEMAGNRGIYHEGWYANTTPPVAPWMLNAQFPPVNEYKWELYDLGADYSQANDLAAKMPDKLKQMQALFQQEAVKFNVLPLDNSQFARAIAPRPSAVAGKTVFRYSGKNIGIPTGNSPSILNRSFTITAEVEVPAGGGNGMIVTEGGRWGGYGLYLLNGVPVFDYNLLMLLDARWAPESQQPLAAGKHTIVFDFHYDGPGLAKSGTGVSEGGRQRGPHAFDPEDDPVPASARRDLRRRRRHPHGRERPGLPGAVRLRRDDRRAHHRARTVADRARGTDEGCGRGSKGQRLAGKGRKARPYLQPDEGTADEEVDRYRGVRVVRGRRRHRDRPGHAAGLRGRQGDPEVLDGELRPAEAAEGRAEVGQGEGSHRVPAQRRPGATGVPRQGRRSRRQQALRVWSDSLKV